MTERLDSGGLFIDRTQTIEFEFEGKTYRGFKGDTLASALLANNCWLLSRSFKYHRPRGPLSMQGHDANCLVQLPQTPNVLADTLPLTPGLKAKGQNYSGSLERDRDYFLNYLSRFLKVGFYYRAFFKPMGIWPKWEKLIRKKAGLGVLNTENLSEPEYCDKAYLFCDVAIVGAGPAGLQTAITAAASGAKVILIEAEPIVGGTLNHYSFGISHHANQVLQNLLKHLDALPNIQVLTNANCSGWFAEQYIAVMQNNRLLKIRAKQCIFATGVLEQQAVFHNNDLPGIIFASAALRLIKLYGVKPGHTAVVLTSNDNGYYAAITLLEAGITVAAIVDLRPEQPSALAKHLTAQNIPILENHAIYQANGKNQHLCSVDVRPILAQGEVGETPQIIKCDLLCMSVGVMPAWHLPCIAGAKLHFVKNRTLFELQGLAANNYLAGSVNGKYELSKTLADGTFSAQQALASMATVPSTSSQVQPVIDNSTLNAAWPIFSHPKGNEFVDFDEDLHVRDMEDATDLGYRHMQLLKRFSTLGMGPSQGRHSALAAAKNVAKKNGVDATQTGVTTARAPAVAEPLVLLSGRKFSPHKQTPMHYLHLQLGAQMMPAGVWQRPAYYGEVNKREQIIAQEVTHVRNQLGVIDLSTLGGLELRGPDAVEMLNRIYTGSFSKLAVGKIRYALMCNLQGAVMDDGVVFRIDEQHFYITATTTGVDRVYRELTLCNAQWRLDVDIYNVTSRFAAVNIAGPYARHLLKKLLPQTDVSDNAFPFMTGLNTELLGVPARIMRVGFVGELGFEIHIPSNYGAALWQHLLNAGLEWGISPFGVEAQRLLRLEKGHIIVGQDTDALSHPAELDMAWAVNKTKPFCISKKSLEILNSQPLKRMLVGFTMPEGLAAPKEGHLVLSDGAVVGNITSVNYSPTLNCIIGLAYTQPVLDSKTGEPSAPEFITLKVDNDVRIRARVCSVPFYDPQNTRQKGGDDYGLQTQNSYGYPVGQTNLYARSPVNDAVMTVLDTQQSNLQLADLTLHARIGLRGAGASEFLKNHKWPQPDKPNTLTQNKNGTTVLRLSKTEFWLLDGVEEYPRFSAFKTKLATLHQSNIYPLQCDHSHAWFMLKGEAKSQCMAKLCAVDLSPEAFPLGSIAQTSVARTSAIVAHHNYAGVAVFSIFCDVAYANYFYQVLQDAIKEWT